MRRTRSGMKREHLWCVCAFLGFVFGLFPSLARADLANCSVTPAIATSNYPGFTQVMTSNQLAQPPGKSIPAAGRMVKLSARVLDRNCVPVSEAKVDLWQTNPDGQYRYATRAALATPDAVFAGAGRTTTDNLGRFQFDTLYPGDYSYRITTEGGSRVTIYRAPHLNIKISHPDLRDFQTNLFFEGDSGNPRDHQLRKRSEAQQQKVMMALSPLRISADGLEATIDIVLPAASPFRRF